MKIWHISILVAALACGTSAVANDTTQKQTCGQSTFKRFIEAGRMAEFTRVAIENQCAKIQVYQRPPVCKTILRVSNTEITQMFLSIVENEIPCDIAREATANWSSKVGAEVVATQLREIREQSYTYLTPAQISVLDSHNKSRAGVFLREHFGSISSRVATKIAELQ